MLNVADLLIRNARLVSIGTGEHGSPKPMDVLVQDGMVTGVGEQLDRPPTVEEIDAAGRWCIPGLWDQHVHMTQWTLTARRLDLAATRTPEEVLAAVAEQVGAASGQPVIGWGHRSGGLSRAATVAELDAVSGDTPVVLVSGDGHHGWLNSAGLRALGLPPGDTVIRENVWFARTPASTRLPATAVPHHPRSARRWIARRRAGSSGSSTSNSTLRRGSAPMWSLPEGVDADTRAKEVA